MKMNISEIIIDERLQRRVTMDAQVIEDYAEAYKAGVRFDDVSLFREGDKLYLVDGFHRVAAATVAGLSSIDAEETPGTFREAWVHSLGVNDYHGLRRSSADKRKTVLDALADDELTKWSSMRIAKVCNVSHTLVDRIRHEPPLATNASGERTYTTKHGTEAVMQTANIGQKSSAQAPKAATPGAAPPAAITPDALDPDGLDAIIIELQERISEHDELIASLEQTDRGAELVKLVKMNQHYRREIGVEQDKNVMLIKQRDDLQRFQNRVRDAVGADDPRSALTMIRARFAKVAA